MEKLYRQFRWKIAAAIFFIFLVNPLFAQQTLQGIVRIKVSETLAEQLEATEVSKSLSGEILTGVESLDHINREFKVRQFTRVFPHAGKDEARHRKYGLHLWYEVRPDRAIPVAQVLQSYRADARILKAEPVYQKTIIGAGSASFGPRAVASPLLPGSLPEASNDPFLKKQWHYKNTGQSGGKPGADIRLFDAWKAETGNPNVIVAVTDGGIQTNHPDLTKNLWVNKGEIPGNDIDDDQNGYVDDIHGYGFVNGSGDILADDHGTHVAGTIAAVNNNGLGVAGVAGGSGNNDGVRLMSCAVFSEGDADGFPQAYVYSADNGAVISQNSWGYTLPGVFEQVVLDAIDYFIAEAGKDDAGRQTGPLHGGLVIFSAGNYNDEGNFYPAYYEPVLAVGSTTHNDTKAQYSNYGPWVDISAPGGETYESSEEGIMSTLSGGKYGFFMGTSMACPHVSGVAGLVVSKFAKQGLLPENIRERLIRSVDGLDAMDPSYAGKMGSGRLNAALALAQDDAVPPAAVSDLAVAGKAIGEVTLTWTSPRDDGGFAAAYDLRYSTQPITEANFSQAQAAIDISAPQREGLKERFTIKNLQGGIRFYFALRSVDFEGNVSALSNVVSTTSALTPALILKPTSLTENLQTAQHSSRTFTISNAGKGSLKFSLREPENDGAFSTYTPRQGTVLPGAAQQITVTFDAAGMYSGTYRQDIIIETNDPANPTVVYPLTLQIQNNGAPIATVTPPSLDFKSARIGTTLERNFAIFNEGSDNLQITGATFSVPVFSTDLPMPFVIAPFTRAEIAVHFSPKDLGVVTGKLILRTNDPAQAEITVSLYGEGLAESPVVASPDALHAILPRGSKTTRSLVLSNNGSQDRQYRMEVMNNRLANGGTVYTRDNTAGRRAGGVDTVGLHQQRLREVHRKRLATASPETQAMVKAIGPPAGNSKSTSSQGRKATSSTPDPKQYATGFEEFNLGPMGEQNGWYSTAAWNISPENPEQGAQHLRGVSEVSGAGEQFAMSPHILEYEDFYYPQYTFTSMRLNLDQAKGTSWEVVPQDPWSYVATRIRFNADGTIEAMVIDNDYNFTWKKVPAATPEGYFDLAVEYNGAGSDTSGFPTYYLFINNQHVFSGTGLGSGIGQVAFVSPMETSGALFDVDDVKLMGGEYIPSYLVPSPRTGTIPAGESVSLNVTFDASVMKFGSYASDLVVRLDETDSVLVPTTLDVVGKASIARDIYAVHMEIDKGETGMQPITLTNDGGQDVTYTLALESEIPGLTISAPQGTIPVRGQKVVQVEFAGKPGVYKGKLVLTTDVGDIRIEFPVKIVVFDTEADFVAPGEATYDVIAGEITTRTIQLSNKGKNTVSFICEVTTNHPWITLDPREGIIADQPLELTVTLDARALSPGTQKAMLTFETNDPDKLVHWMYVTLNILPDTAGPGKILREVWTNIPGKEISSIPVNTAPASTSMLDDLESPANTGDQYGSRIRGYVRAPLDGYYTFWIASNDHSELWLSTNADEKNKVRIASVSGYTNPRQWTKYSTQTSKAIYLEANRQYYLEALHKESVGTDHLAVGWRLPDQTLERPIPGMRLTPYGADKPNEAPTVNITSPNAGKIFSAPASIEIQAVAQDPDGSIVNVEFFNGATKLGADTSVPYSFAWKNVPAGIYEIVVRATDNEGETDTASVEVTVNEGQACTGTGSIMREQWNNISGTLISSIPLNSEPSEVQALTVFESPANTADNYGSRVSGLLCVPVSGEYTFWIASNDKSELWLSTDSNPLNKVQIANVSGYTNPRQWLKYPSQQSAPVQLEKGVKYYIEALHKEGVGSDHLAVGWQLPDGTLERPLPGIRLMPFGNSSSQTPGVRITSPENGSRFAAPATVEISAEASDADGTIAKVTFFNGNEKIGEDLTYPYSFVWTPVAEGTYSITAVSTDDAGLVSSAAPVSFSVEPPNCTASGTITREVWTGVPGNRISDMPLTNAPNHRDELTIFETPGGAGSHYGARVRGYICPPQTGDYYFWISGNDQGELWLSSDEDPVNKKMIAHVSAPTEAREWNKYASQKSQAIRLTAGKTYYIEALHKQGVGSDHMAVGWQLPDGTAELPIAGNRLSPVRVDVSLLQETTNNIFAEGAGDVHVFPNPVKGENLHIVLQNFSGLSGATMAILIRQHNGTMEYRSEVTCTEDCSTEISVSDHFKVPGLYILQIRIGDQTITKKLIVP